MKKFIAYYGFLLKLILLYILSSCTNKHFNNNEFTSGDTVSTGSDKSVLLKLQLLDNTNIYYKINNETSIQQEINDEKTENENKIDMDVYYTIKKDTNDLYNLVMRYDKFKIYTKANDKEKEIDASSASSSIEPADRLFSVFNNATIGAVVTSQGIIKSVSGVKELHDKLYSLTDITPVALENMPASAKQFFSDAFFKTSIEHNFKVYPPKPVKEGDTWELSDTLQSELQVPVKITYKLESLDDGIATISLSSDISIDEPIQVQGYTANANMDGNEEGKLKIKISSGLLQSSETSFNIKGKIEILGKEISIKYKTVSTIIGK
jgi:hypothetical protein